MSWDEGDYEGTFLGACLIRPEILLDSEILQPSDFHDRRNRAVYRAMRAVMAETGEVDWLSVIDKVEEEKIFADGAAAYISELANNGFPSMARPAMRHILKNSDSRYLQFVLADAQRKIEEGEETTAVYQSLQGGVLSFANRRPSSADNPLLVLDEIQADHDMIDAGGMIGIPTCDKLDAAIPIWARKTLTIIGGYTSHGKSTLLADILARAGVDHGARVVVFTLEDSRKMKAIKFLSWHSRITQTKIIMNRIESHWRGDYEKAREWYRAWKPVIYDDVRTVEDIRLKIIKEKMRGAVDLVAIDFVQNLKGDPDLYRRMSHAALELQEMTASLDIAMIALSQIDNATAREGSGGALIGLKGAGELAAAADIVIKPFRPEKNNPDIDIIIEKNRIFGQTGVIKCSMTDGYTRINRRGIS